MTLTVKEAAAYVVAVNEKNGIHDVPVTIIPDAVPFNNNQVSLEIVARLSRSWSAANKVAGVVELRKAIPGLGLAEAKRIVQAGLGQV